MLLYHYSSKPRKELLTLNLQKGTKNSTNDRFDEISLMIDKLPINYVVKQTWPDNHAYNKKIIYCHTINTEDLDKSVNWRLAESPLDVFLRDKFWVNNKIYKVCYQFLHEKFKMVFREKGTNTILLERQVGKYKGTYEKFFVEWFNKKDFAKTHNMYACGVPHILIYTKKPIQVMGVEKVNL